MLKHKGLLSGISKTEGGIHVGGNEEEARWLALGGEVGDFLLFLLSELLGRGTLGHRLFLLLGSVDCVEIWEFFLCHGERSLRYERASSSHVHRGASGGKRVISFRGLLLLLHNDWCLHGYLLHWLVLHLLLLVPHVLLLLILLLLWILRVSAIALGLVVSPNILLVVLLLIILAAHGWERILRVLVVGSLSEELVVLLGHLSVLVTRIWLMTGCSAALIACI